MHIRAEYVAQILAFENARGNTGVYPEKLLGSVHLLSHRHALRAGIDLHEEIHLLLIKQACSLVDRDLGLRLRVGVDGHDLVTLDSTPLVDEIDSDFGADRIRLRATGGKRPGV